MAPTVITLVVCGVLGLIVMGVLFAMKQEKQRTEAFQAIAEQMGLGFYPKGDQSLIGAVDHFHLFSQGRSKRVLNMIYGETAYGELALFDYRYTTGGGKSSQTHMQNVVYFRADALSVPEFAMRPEHLFHKIGSVVGFQDIDFQSHPGFSSRFLLRGQDEAQVRNTFTDEIISDLERRPGISLEAKGSKLVFYRAHKNLKPPEITAFLDEAAQVFKLFTS